MPEVLTNHHQRVAINSAAKSHSRTHNQKLVLPITKYSCHPHWKLTLPYLVSQSLTH
jgi:hypothetical protein